MDTWEALRRWGKHDGQTLGEALAEVAAEEAVEATKLAAILESGVYDIEKMLRLAVLTKDFSALNFPIEEEQKQMDLFEHMCEIEEGNYVMKVVRHPCAKMQQAFSGLDCIMNHDMHREVLETDDWLNTYTDPELIDHLLHADDSEGFPVHRFCRGHWKE